jgi:hypothetical protein
MFSKSKCKNADTDADIFPKTFLKIISENYFCILAGSGYRQGSINIHLFSGSKMNKFYIKILHEMLRKLYLCGQQ